MIEVILAIKFVHVLAAAIMFGAWLCLALFMVLAHRSANSSVVALTARFVVGVEFGVIAPAVALQPISGLLLAAAIGLSSADALWVEPSLAVYGLVVLAWLAALLVEQRIRNSTAEAVLKGAPLPAGYRRLFRLWSMLALAILAGMVGLFALMIWQPRVA